MAKHIIHVNRQHIAMNAKDNKNRPVYTIKTGSKTRYAREVIIKGPSRMVYNGQQLKCGARAWIETDSDVELVDEMTFKQAKQGMSKSKCITLSTGNQIWMHKKVLHREDGPAIVDIVNKKYKYYLNGELKTFKEWLSESGKYYLESKEVTWLLMKGY